MQRQKKMHHGHRGANHPIKNQKNGRVEITVQNHGFVVSKNKFLEIFKSLTPLYLTEQLLD